MRVTNSPQALEPPNSSKIIPPVISSGDSLILRVAFILKTTLRDCCLLYRTYYACCPVIKNGLWVVGSINDPAPDSTLNPSFPYISFRAGPLRWYASMHTSLMSYRERFGCCVLARPNCDCQLVVVGGDSTLAFFGLGMGRKGAGSATFTRLVSLPFGTGGIATIRRLDGGPEESVKGSSTWLRTSSVLLSLLPPSARISFKVHNGVSSSLSTSRPADPRVLVGVLVDGPSEEAILPTLVLRADLGVDTDTLPLARP
jgi:hypothetical protein